MRTKLLVLTLLVIFGYGLYYFAFSGGIFVNAACANVVGYAIVLGSFFGLILGIGYTFKNSSPGGALIGLLIGCVTIFLITSVLVSTMGKVEVITASICDNCSDMTKYYDRLDRVEAETDLNERTDGYRKLEASIDDFIEGEQDREDKIPDDVSDAARPVFCRADGEVYKARLLLSRLTNIEIPWLRKLEPKSIVDSSVCSEAIASANADLDQAESYLVANNGDSQQLQLVKTHRETLDEAAAKCALPDDKSISVLDKRMNSPHYEVDVKVFDGEGTFVANAESMIEVWRASENIEAKVEAINGGEPLCLAVVADNSQSIVDPDVNPDGKKNLEYISQALITLNELRKSDDYYSLITFGGPNEIVQVRNLDKSGVPTDKIDAKGGNTAIWDAVKVGIDQLSDCRYPKRTLLLLTDGEDNSSVFMKTSPKTPPAEIVKALNKLARDKGIFFNILAVGPAVKNPDLKSFDTTSGAFIALNDFAGLSAKISEMVGAQQNFYRIHIPLELLDDVKLLKLRITGGTSEVTVEIGNS